MPTPGNEKPNEKPVVSVLDVPPEPPETTEVNVGPAPVPTSSSAEDQLAAKIREDFEKLYGGRIRELQNGYHAIQRVNTKLQQEIAQLKAGEPASSASASGTSPATNNPWATIQDGPTWRAEIERVADERAKAIYQQQEVIRANQEALARDDAIREHWKQQVMTKYPDLAQDGNADSVVSVAFNAVLNEHPEYLRNPYGPRLAMADMEERLKAQAAGGGTLPPAEASRRARADAASLPPSRTATPSSTKVILTKDEMEFCRYNKIDPVVYAKNRQLLESTGSLEVP